MKAKFIIRLDYPRMKHLGTIHQEADERFVNLEITTEKKLPELFFRELEELVSKHLTEPAAPIGDK